MSKIVQVDEGRVQVALTRFALNLQQRGALLKVIAAGMLASVRRTFADQGVPADSWTPLADSTRRNPASKATAGRKILILSGRLLNSIQAQATDTGIVVGTNLVYARVQQEGSADRRGGAFGPQARIAGRSVKVDAHPGIFNREIHYSTRPVVSGGKTSNVPVAMRTGKREITDKRGRKTQVRAAYQGPRQQQAIDVAAHERFQNIPARPYLVIRPDDPSRILGEVVAYGVRSGAVVGLDVRGAA